MQEPLVTLWNSFVKHPDGGLEKLSGPPPCRQNLVLNIFRCEFFSIRTFCPISCRRWRCRVWGGRKTLAPPVIPHTVVTMRIVIDTNVIVSGLRSTKGASFRVLRGVQTGVVKPVVPVALFLEYQDVLPRPGLLPAHMPPHAILAFLDAFLLKSELQDIFFKWRPWLPDPKDECFDSSRSSSTAFGVIFEPKTSFLHSSSPSHNRALGRTFLGGDLGFGFP